MTSGSASAAGLIKNMTDESLYPRWPESGRLVEDVDWLATEEVAPDDALGRQCYDWGDDARSLVTIASVATDAEGLVTDVRHVRDDGADRSVYLRGLPLPHVEVMVRPTLRSGMVCCNACGALVGNWAMHSRWHEELSRKLFYLEGGEEED